jgi:hypothetical protein
MPLAFAVLCRNASIDPPLSHDYLAASARQWAHTSLWSLQ